MLTRPVVLATALSLGEDAPSALRPLRVFAQTHMEPTLIAAHRHPDQLQLLCAIRGVFRVVSDESIWVVPPGRAILVPTAFEHAVHAPGHASLRAIGIHPSALDIRASRCRVLSLAPLAVALIEAAAQLPAAYELGGAETRLVDVLLDQLRAAPEEPLHLPRPKDRRARTVADALVSEPGNGMTLDAWARRVGASRRTLARLFEAETGLGFRDYRLQAQLHAAIGLLAGGASINDTAYHLGYESPSAFIHAFRRLTGMTPGKYLHQPELHPGQLTGDR